MPQYTIRELTQYERNKKFRGKYMPAAKWGVFEDGKYVNSARHEGSARHVAETYAEHGGPDGYEYWRLAYKLKEAQKDMQEFFNEHPDFVPPPNLEKE